jgi:hypothetical protein
MEILFVAQYNTPTISILICITVMATKRLQWKAWADRQRPNYSFTNFLNRTIVTLPIAAGINKFTTNTMEVANVICKL